MHEIINIFLHLDKSLADIVVQHGAWVYGLLFVIVFCETGLVVTPFLPGDSLLFAVGALSVSDTHALDLWIAAPLMFVAAIAGNTSNYHIGKYIGPAIFRGETNGGLLSKLMNRKHLDKAHAFFEKHGGKAVMIGQFVPIVRTFCPFVAGAGTMSYHRFIAFNVAGALLWVGLCSGAGALFGNIPVVKNNFSLVVLGIIAVSLIPVALEVIKSRCASAAAQNPVN